ncbi:multidrug efflux MFS transporter EmrD [Kistimonas scapharcae]|uniref:Bcr/CflA family efflux transporter n=1 Tax=Kistimonas scapharcae TaxID=1036133 RepID=A0ABP8V9Z4_9GAMM
MKKQSFFEVLLVILLITAVGQMTNTIYVPALPMMANDLQVLPSQVQAVMAFYLIPYGLSQFIYGPLSDRLGRKPVMLMGLIVFLAGSIMAVMSNRFEFLLAASFIQGMGTGTGGVMARTVMRDLYSGRDLQMANSYVSMGLIFTPLIAPLLGGWLTESWNWQANFVFLTIFGAVVWTAVALMFRETCPEQPARTSVIHSYKTVLGHEQFQGFILCLIATFAGIAVFEAASGVLFGNVLGYDATTTSLLFIVPIPGYLLGSWLAGKLADRLSMSQVMLRGILLLLAGAIGLLLPGLFGHISAVALLIPGFLYFMGTGIVFPTATTGAIEPFPTMAGVAGAVLGGLQNLGAGLVTLAASMVPMHNQVPLGIILLVLSLMVTSVYLLRLRSTDNNLHMAAGG